MIFYLPNKVFLILIWVYQKTISPLLGPRCRYWPSCSTYAQTAFRTHNVLKALLLSVWRIVRCNPLSEGGLDPVPTKGKWIPEIHTDGSPRG